MQVRLAEADSYHFNKLADHTTLILIESSQLLKQFRVDLNL